MKKERKQLYEGMYVVNATLSEEMRGKAIERITKGIEKRKGVVHKIHERGRQKLSYPIKERKEGYYYLIYFTLSSLEMKDLWKEHNLHEDLLRFMTLSASDIREEITFKPLKESVA